MLKALFLLVVLFGMYAAEEREDHPEEREAEVTAFYCRCRGAGAA
jgi:hypothetical protein